jgi:hypothetical protein
VLCQHQDYASLAADSGYRALYAEVVGLYASIARNSPKKLGKNTSPVPHHDALRLRKIGVAAITSIFSPNDQYERPWNREYDSAFTSVLTNIRNPDKHDYIDYLQGLNRELREKDGRESIAMNRRHSVATVRTHSGYQEEQEPNPRTAEGTAQDADRIEEEEVGLLAIDCIKAIFETQNRVQIRAATMALMGYVSAENGRKDVGDWASQLFRLITTWTPVQDRFIIIFTAVETLQGVSVDDSNFVLQETYAKMIRSVLCSELNLIGLSVMDVLVALMTTTIYAVTQSSRPQSENKPTTTSSEHDAVSATIIELKQCISCLASDVYYSDQVTDMIAAILVRVKAYPSATDVKRDIFGRSRSRSRTRTTGSKPNGVSFSAAKNSANDVASMAPGTSGTPQRDQSTLDQSTDASVGADTSEKTSSLRSGHFTTDEARKCALEIIRDILVRAQSSRRQGQGNVMIGRNRVPVGVWEGTQWLARTGPEEVRDAYKDAVAMWAKLESDEKDSNILDFEADDCFGKFVERSRAPSSVRGSIGPSHQSHPQLLMLPNFGVERRLSAGKEDACSGVDVPRPRVKATDLEEIMAGKREVELHQHDYLGHQIGTDGPTESSNDLQKLLAGIQVEDEKPNRVPIMAAPPY